MKRLEILVLYILVWQANDPPALLQLMPFRHTWGEEGLAQFIY